ncbi:MAG: DUF4815 domain-containing protein [Legionella sp.]|uniref:DUF4815 domain-containing protein n=1 Tax=Legionella sp. TaxID=459 RepID=UPI00283FF265|nr:DUF4815 domain-containing protein [Legionella sp.]
MSLQTNLNTNPYYDGFDPSNKRYQVLFKPGVSVQIGEFNELQSILQNQIEKFGDNIYKNGTIISGCAISFNSNYAYIKVADNTIDGTPAELSNYLGCYAYNTSGLCGIIQNYVNGYQSTDPNLKTLYVNYINSGNNYQQTSFMSGDTLTITDANNSMRSVTIVNPATQFSNSDSLQFVSALSVNVSTTNTFSNGETIICASSNQQAQICGINTTAIANTLVLNIKPLLSDLSNVAGSNTVWSFTSNSSIYGLTSGATASVVKPLGNSASGQIITDGSGRVVDVVITVGGYGYIVPPYVTVKPVALNSSLSSLQLTGRNYVDTLTVPSANNTNGFGYAMSVSNGVIFQQGYFLGVDSQTLIVDNYDQTPNNVSVAFQVVESIINYNTDATLLDPFNNMAPGADRLVLTPVLTTVNTSTISASQSYLPLVSFNNGNPFLINQTSQYNVIEDEMAARTKDESGNFALDQFLATSASTSNVTNEGNTVSIVIDPGKAYIDGYLIESNSNYTIDINKGIDIVTSNAALVSIDYDNYIRVSEVGGYFQFNTGDTVTFYDTPKQFITNTAYASIGNTAAIGNTLGTASLKNMVLESGFPGTNTAIYRLHIFNLNMNSFANFNNVRSVHYINGSLSGIADLVLTQNTVTASNVAVVVGNNDTSLYQTNLPTLNSTNNITYVYRTVNTQIVLANTGLATISLAGNPNETFNYSSILTTPQLEDLYIVPQVGLTYSNQITAANTVSTLTGNNWLMGSATTTFISTFAVGDYVYVNNNTTGNNVVKRINQIVNNSVMVLDSNIGFSSSNNAVYRYFPQNVPVPFGTRSGLSANLNGSLNVLTVNFGNTFLGSTSSNVTISYSVIKAGATPGTKTPNRNLNTIIYTGNNASSNTGPWCLGVSDIFRLRSVLTSGNNTGWGTATDVTNYFLIDSNQQSDYNGLGSLYLDPTYSLSVNTSQYFLVTFDAYTSSGSNFYNATSYISANTTAQCAVEALPLANLTSQVSAWEVPEFYQQGVYHDMLNEFDFRIAAANTANLATTSATATINPSATLSFGNTSSRADLKVPLPASLLTCTINTYSCRIDSLIVDTSENFNVIRGPSGISNITIPSTPKNSLVINNFYIPPFPTIAQNPSSQVLNVVNTRVSSGQLTPVRAQIHTVASIFTETQIDTNQPTSYSMASIASLENRIKALEYYASLSSLESAVTNANIPSAVSASNRYVFGFYVDGFSTANNMNMQDSQFSATVDTVNQLLLPKEFSINLPHGNTTLYAPQYIEYPVVSQLSATYDPLNPPAPCTLDSTEAIVIVAQTRQQSNPTVAGTVANTQPDNLSVSMASTNGPVALYFYTYSNYTDFIITQNGTTIATSNNAVPLTSSDVSTLNQNAYFKDPTISLSTSFFTQNANGYVSGCGKIMFNHNAALGQNYVVETQKGVGDSLWRYLIEYPIDSSSYVDCQVDTGGTPLPPPPPPVVVVTPPAPPVVPPAPAPAPNYGYLNTAGAGIWYWSATPVGGITSIAIVAPAAAIPYTHLTDISLVNGQTVVLNQVAVFVDYSKTQPGFTSGSTTPLGFFQQVN